MSVAEIIATTETVVGVECLLSASDSYIETLSISPIAALPGQNELVIKTQLLSAKNPLEKRVKTRCCIDDEQLVALRDSLSLYLAERTMRGVQQ
jgi:hypothetical protein